MPGLIIYKSCPTPQFLLRTLFSLSIHFSPAKFMSADELFDFNGSDDNTDGADTEESEVDASERERVRAIMHVPPPNADISVVQQVSNVY